MEYVPSRSLEDLVRKDGPLEPDVAARVGVAVLDGLAATHRAGVLHRDVKPPNMLIADDGRSCSATSASRSCTTRSTGRRRCSSRRDPSVVVRRHGVLLCRAPPT